MKLTKILTVAVALFTTSVSVFGQDIEGGIFVGPTNYQGDVTKKHVTIKNTRPNIGLLGRYYFGPRFNLKGNLYYGWVRGDDENYNDVKFRDKRNANFKSTIFDFGVQGELNILPFISNSKRYKFAPYVFGGVSLFHFNPKSTVAIRDAAGAVTKEETYALQTLGTEGQFLDGSKIKPYKRWQGAIPYGIGVKYSLGNFWNIGLEIGQRKIFTDYLDDVSTNYPDMAKQAAWSDAKFKDQRAVYASAPRDLQKYPLKGGLTDLSNDERGNKDRNDMYIFTGITLTKTLRRFSCTNF
jgi:hypothetical protein